MEGWNMEMRYSSTNQNLMELIGILIEYNMKVVKDNLSDHSRGILYIATGSKFVREAVKSSRSVKENAGLNTAIITDRSIDSSYFDVVKRIEEGLHNSYGDKPTYISESPFDKTVFLDTDTFVVDKLDELFLGLNEYDISVSHAPARKTNRNIPSGEVTVDQIPKSFCEFNTGVIVFRTNEKIKHLFSTWEKEYINDNKNQKDISDQPSFRRALYGSNVDFTTLPPEYNCRFIYPGYVWGKVKIFHGRNGNMREIKGKVNSTHGMRVHIPKGKKVRIERSQNPSVISQGIRSIRRKGLIETIRRLSEKLKH
jgi:hypothetical protein